MKSAKRPMHSGIATTKVLGANFLARIKAYRAHREALRRLADDVAVRKMLVGVDFAKRRAAQLNAASRRTYADGIDGWFARGGK